MCGCVALIPIILSPNNTKIVWLSFPPLYHPTTPRLFGSHSTIFNVNPTSEDIKPHTIIFHHFITQQHQDCVALVSTTFSPSNA